MFIEIVCILSVIGFMAALILDRDIRYLIFFAIGFLISLTGEARGVSLNYWVWNNTSSPLSYMLFGLPIGALLIYSCSAGLSVFFVKYMIKLREKYKEELDKKVAYALIIIGTALVLMHYVGFNWQIGAMLIMAGVYLIVKNPIMFYTGAAALILDLIIDNLFIATNELTYTYGYGATAINFFMAGAILTGVVILLGKKLKLNNKLKSPVGRI